MTTTPSTPGAPITHKRQLVESLESGCKPPAAWRVGTEHEKFVFRRSDLRRVPYEGPDGIAAILREMTRFGWKPIIENGNTIALANDARCSITLEPGGQFELSGAPLETVHQTCDEVHEHLRQVREVCDELGLGMLGLGFDPKWRREDVPFMPKARYRIMRDYMPKKGRLGLDMMLRTCTVQTNLDYQSEADMVKKFRVSLALQPVAVALFANSPFVEGSALEPPQLSQLHLDRYRPGPLRYLALCLRAGLRVRALRRLHARCADVFRVPRWKIHRRERAVVPRFHCRQAADADQ
jgi:glutamate--cysteine ligase